MYIVPTLIFHNQTTTYQFHCIRDNDFVRVCVSCSSRVRYCVTKWFEAGFRSIFNDLVDFCDLQAMLKIPFEEGRGKQNFFPFHASDETASGFRHDVVLLSVTFHELPNIVTADVGVFKDRAHLAELVLEVIWHANIHFHTTKQTLISHLAQNLLGAHRFHLIQLSLYFGSDESLQFMICFLHLAIHTPTSLPRCILYS